MRKLNTADMFSFCRFIRKIGIKDELKKIAMEANGVKDIYDNGFEIVYTLLEVITEKGAEKELYKFLSKPFEMEAAEIEKMDLEEFVKGLQRIADFETWKLFFKQAVRTTR